MVAEPHFLDLTRRTQSQPHEKSRLNVRLDVPGGVSFAPDRLNPHNSAKRVFRVPQLPEPRQLFYNFEREIAEHDGVSYVPSSSFVIGDDDELTPSQKIAQDVREKYEAATELIKSDKPEDNKMEALLNAMNLNKGFDEKQNASHSDLRTKDLVSDDVSPDKTKDADQIKQNTMPGPKKKREMVSNESRPEPSEAGIHVNPVHPHDSNEGMKLEEKPKDKESKDQRPEDVESKEKNSKGEKSKNKKTKGSFPECNVAMQPASTNKTSGTEELNTKGSNATIEKEDNVSFSESRDAEEDEDVVNKEAQRTGTDFTKSGMTKSQAKRAKKTAKEMIQNGKAIDENVSADERSDRTNTSNEGTNSEFKDMARKEFTNSPEEPKDQSTSHGSGINLEVNEATEVNDNRNTDDKQLLDHLEAKTDYDKTGEEHVSKTDKKIESRYNLEHGNDDLSSNSFITNKEDVYNMNLERAEIKSERPADAMTMQTARTQFSTFAPTVSGFSVMADRTRSGKSDGLPAIVREKLNHIDYKLPPSISDESHSRKPWNSKSYLKSRTFERLASQPEGRDAGTQWNAINGPGEETLALPTDDVQSITFDTLASLFVPDPRHWHPYRFVRRTNPRQVLLMCAGTALTQKQLQTSELARKVASGQMGPINDAKSLASYFTTTENTTLQGGLGFVYSPNEALCHAMHERLDLKRAETNFSRRLERPEFPNETSKRRAALRSVIAALEYVRWEEEGFDKIVIATHHGWIVRGIAYEYVARESLT